MTVSVIIPTFDRLLQCQAAIRSALVQSHNDIEVIVVEDGSRSGIENWLQEQRLDHVRYIQHKHNRGLAAARNTGLLAANGEFAAFLDDDDEWMPEKTEGQVALIRQLLKSAVVVYCGAYVLNGKGRQIGINRPRLRGSIREAIKERGLWTVPSSMLIRRKSLLELGGFDEALESHIDHDIWLKLADAGFHADFVSRPMVNSYEHTGLRLTTDVNQRIAALDYLLGKWEGRLVDWLGKEGYKHFGSAYYARVAATTAAISFSQGNLSGSLRAIRAAVEQFPNSPITYSTLAKVFISRIVSHSGLYLAVKGGISKYVSR